tara:strand:- start:41 stop:559 length:519 start_codon:yes stop_codon:yes gene_type:complete
MKNKIFLLSAIIFFIILFSIFYKGLRITNVYTPNIDLNENIPEFKTITFETKDELGSREIFINDSYYLLNIWSSWCIPCRAEHKFMMKLKKKDNLEIIGLNYKDKMDNAKFFLDELGNPYEKILVDNDGTIAIEWGAYGVPESFLIYEKKIIKKFIGPLDEVSFLEIEGFLK